MSAGLEALARRHARGESAAYYDVRARFNALRRRAAGGRHSPPLAAMLLYLNRTGFNGLVRLNAGGDFNVPAGRYLRPRICNAALVRQAADALGRPGIELRLCGFEDAVEDASAGDSSTSIRRTRRSAPHPRSPAVQPRASRRTTRNASAAEWPSWRGRGCHAMVSNSSAPEIESLYRRAGGGHTLSLWHRRGGRSTARASGRGAIPALLLTSLHPSRQPAVAVRLVWTRPARVFAFPLAAATAPSDKRGSPRQRLPGGRCAARTPACAV